MFDVFGEAQGSALREGWPDSMGIGEEGQWAYFLELARLKSDRENPSIASLTTVWLMDLCLVAASTVGRLDVVWNSSFSCRLRLSRSRGYRTVCRTLVSVETAGAL